MSLETNAAKVAAIKAKVNALPEAGGTSKYMDDLGAAENVLRESKTISGELVQRIQFDITPPAALMSAYKSAVENDFDSTSREAVRKYFEQNAVVIYCKPEMLDNTATGTLETVGTCFGLMELSHGYNGLYAEITAANDCSVFLSYDADDSASATYTEDAIVTRIHANDSTVEEGKMRFIIYINSAHFMAYGYDIINAFYGARAFNLHNEVTV